MHIHGVPYIVRGGGGRAIDVTRSSRVIVQGRAVRRARLLQAARRCCSAAEFLYSFVFASAADGSASATSLVLREEDFFMIFSDSRFER